MSDKKHPFEPETLEALKVAQDAVEAWMRLAHRDRIADGFFGDPTTWDDKETESANIDGKLFTGFAVVGHFEPMEFGGSVNVLYGTPLRQSPALTKGLFGYAYDAFA